MALSIPIMVTISGFLWDIPWALPESPFFIVIAELAPIFSNSTVTFCANDVAPTPIPRNTLPPYTLLVNILIFIYTIYVLLFNFI